MNKKKYLKNNKGQNLLELVLALGLASIIIYAIVMLNISNLKSSQFSQNQTQATKLAQEGIELLRIMREQNNSVCNYPGNTSNVFNGDITAGSGMLGKDGSCLAGCRAIIKKSPPIPGTCTPPGTPSLWLNVPSLASEKETITIGNATFSREVNIIDDPLPNQNRKQLTVSVSWRDSTGTHESKLSTLLGKK